MYLRFRLSMHPYLWYNGRRNGRQINTGRQQVSDCRHDLICLRRLEWLQAHGYMVILALFTLVIWRDRFQRVEIDQISWGERQTEQNSKYFQQVNKNCYQTMVQLFHFRWVWTGCCFSCSNVVGQPGWESGRNYVFSCYWLNPIVIV